MYTRVYIHLIIADLIAGLVYYLFQHLISAGPIRVTFLRVACSIFFNLLESVIYRLLYQSGFEYGERPQKTQNKYTRLNKMEKRTIKFSPPDISEAEIAEVAEALRSGWITTGPRTKHWSAVLQLI